MRCRFRPCRGLLWSDPLKSAIGIDCADGTMVSVVTEPISVRLKRGRLSSAAILIDVLKLQMSSSAIPAYSA